MKISDIFNEKNMTMYPFDKIYLDNYFYEGFQDDDSSIAAKTSFEMDDFGHRNVKNKKIADCYINQDESILKYFLDGTRKPYKIGDIVIDNNLTPLVVGQIRAGCCERVDKNIQPYKIEEKNVLVFFNKINTSDYNEIKQWIESIYKDTYKITVDKYSHNVTTSRDMVTSAVSKIQTMMQKLEVDMINEMVTSNKLDTGRLLVVDGPIRFSKDNYKRYSPMIFYNVIGVSKSFNPNLALDNKHREHIGTRIANLNFGERTPVYKSTFNGVTYGVWYVRIREKSNIKNPLEGVIKVEKMALDKEISTGFNSNVIDSISGALIAERNPTCYGKDNRWANHLYPIYLTEKLIKTSLMSDIYFMNIF